jgi:NTE family protein
VRAIVLSGGGARGAYEAGVLCYLLGEIPKRLGRPVQPDLVLGTSVGAIHACFLAATAHLGPERERRLRETWARMRFDDLFRISAREAVRLPGRLLGVRHFGAALRGTQPPEKLYGLLDTRALERLVVDTIPWSGIRKNLVAGRVQALCVATTQIATGRTVIFVQGRDAARLRWADDPTIVARSARIGPMHALASAAIPVLFPAVRVDGTYYADGGLRMNTPLSPAVHLGADRILVVGLRSAVPTGEAAALAESRVDGYGNPVFLYGKMLNTLLLDHLDTDLGQLRLINSILRSGEKSFGEDFLGELNVAAGRNRAQEGFRVVEDLVLRPSVDLGQLAGSLLGTRSDGSRLPRWLRALVASTGLEADLLSYLFFDAGFTEALLELGWQDARAREDELVAFFSDPP